MRHIFFCPHDFTDKVKHFDLFHLHPVRRLFHRKTRRHLIGFMAGACIMTTGSLVARYGAAMGGLHTEIGADVLGYLIHGVGTIPFLRHIEPLWTVLTGD